MLQKDKRNKKVCKNHGLMKHVVFFFNQTKKQKDKKVCKIHLFDQKSNKRVTTFLTFNYILDLIFQNKKQ